MAKKIKTPLTGRNFAINLYVSLCVDAIMKMRTGEPDTDKKIIELVVPLLDELYESREIFS